ncbi:MAG: zinc ribbon domain-containing protein [Dehalococcoidia bacterium]|nr:zinc ribbon domain-containing protein [Dehalococcoidia bacterium]
MPTYEYDCAGCNQRVDVFFRSASAAMDATPACPECGATSLTRRMSKFVRARSESDRLDSIDIDGELGRLRGDDPGSFARWSKQLGSHLGEDLGSDFTQMAERAYAGEDPVERIDPAHTLRYRIEKRKAEASGDAAHDGHAH